MKLSDAISFLSVGDSVCSTEGTFFKADYGFEDGDGRSVDIGDYDLDSEGWWIEGADHSDDTAFGNVSRVPARHWYL